MIKNGDDDFIINFRKFMEQVHVPKYLILDDEDYYLLIKELFETTGPATFKGLTLIKKSEIIGYHIEII